MATLLVNAAKAAFMVTVATSMSIGTPDLYNFLTVQVKNEIMQTITGSNDSIEEQIDENLAWMQVAMGSIDVLDVASD